GLADAARELAALEAATAGVPLDFVLLQSSLVSVLGAAGLAGLAAGCALVDAWAQRHASHGGTRWTSVSWDRWAGDGEASGTAIARADAPRAYGCVAALAREPRVVVCTNDLAARAERLRAPAAVSVDAAEAALHPRPALDTAYHPPTNEAEALLAGMWRELLGIDRIGIHDDFFRLGGHSLLGLQLVSRIRETFQVELPLRAIFEAPTVERLAQAIDEAILLELDEMTDEEALALAESTLA
ncbi:MAG TPA: phosphopantetheine-binding protein, partial [Longimicrobium sp.]